MESSSEKKAQILKDSIVSILANSKSEPNIIETADEKSFLQKILTDLLDKKQI